MEVFVMNRDQIICPCLDITAGQIMDAYKEGAKSVEAINQRGNGSRNSLRSLLG